MVAERNLKGKTFDLGGGRFRHSVCAGALHVPDNMLAWGRGEPHGFVDIDTDFELVGDTFRVKSAFYNLSVQQGVIGYSYESKLSGKVDVTLLTVGDVAPIVPAPRLDGDKLWWDEVSPGVDLYLLARSTGVELFKLIKDKNAVRTLTWQLTEDTGTALKIQKEIFGIDNYNSIPASELGRERGKLLRKLEMETVITPVSADKSFTTYTLTETFTGRTWQMEGMPPSRGKVFYDEALTVYPVLIDTTVNETIGADGDDGMSDGFGTWYNSWNASSHLFSATNPYASQYPGYRFTTVAVPNAATINSATLTIEAGGGSGTPSGTMNGNNVDSAGAWTTTTLTPRNMSATTAGVTFNPSSAGVFTYNVAAIVQEIVNRIGWVSGYNLALGVHSTVNSGNYRAIYDFVNGSRYATLDIDYTAGGGFKPYWASQRSQIIGNRGL